MKWLWLLALSGCFNLETEISDMNPNASSGRKTQFQLGYSQSVLINPPSSVTKSNQGVASLSISGQFDIPDVYTLEFGIEGADTNNIPVADITWAVAGNHMTRQISLVNGVSISGTCEGVRVIVRDLSTSILAGPFSATALCTRGHRATSERPTNQTIPSQSVAAANSVAVKLPVVGASSVFVTAWSNAGDINPRKVLAGQRNAAGTVVHMWDDPSHTGWVPLKAGATELFFINRDAVQVEFSPILGIDG